MAGGRGTPSRWTPLPRSYFDGAPAIGGSSTARAGPLTMDSGSGGRMVEGGRGTPSRWSAPTEGPLRNCRLYGLYHPDYSTPAPAHTSRASARAAPAPPTLVTQGSHRRRGYRTPPLALSLGGLCKGHASAHAKGALAASTTHQGRGDWTPAATLRDGDWGWFRLVGVVCGGGWTAGRRRRR